MKILKYVIVLSLFLMSLNVFAETTTLVDANKIIEELKIEIKNNPSDIDRRIELGVFYFQIQEYFLAKQYFEEALKIDNNNAIARYNLGKTLILLGEKDKGIYECEKSIEFGLDDVNVYKTLSVEYFNKKELKKALEMYKNIQRLEPRNENAYFAAGVIYIGLKDGLKARSEFENVIKINPNNAEAHYELGWLYKDHNPRKSKEHYKKVIELNSGHNKSNQ